MKKIFLSCLLTGLSVAAFAQTDEQLKKLDSARKFYESTDFVYPYIDSSPGYLGGDQKWSKYITGSPIIKNAIDKAKAQNIPEGNYTIIIKFAVNADSTVNDIKAVSKTVGYGLEEAAIKLVQGSGKWIPAHVEGKHIRSYIQLPVRFSIVRK